MGPSQADVGTKEAPRVCLDGPLKLRLGSSSHGIKDLRRLLIVLEASAAVQGGRLCLAQKGATGEVHTQSVSGIITAAFLQEFDILFVLADVKNSSPLVGLSSR